ncbi:unnamed protein product [Vitrella brassicaformis CCMP3155]|uniref:Endonuclease/exonuclease/phosphatase domain-containing protein n=1 Tax=Vitrella brassicaformis (strain CCMP3155) TaxID=1169540 RepID=A0A0G4GBB8_VITBC|nr:unnamed protein product [Vitrella brassicaformis CCMP3155]|eukprot:CEM26444.1 unnamed protein product [Vitrella brassicaformis CCMP3155]
MMLNLALAVAVVLVSCVPPCAGQSVFINEVHYDNKCVDVGEFVEIAGLAGTNLAGWTVKLYNGRDGQVYDTIELDEVLPDQLNGFGVRAFKGVGLQNGPDGLALVNSHGDVEQFVSYGGRSFEALDGPAEGMTSTAIRVSESGTTPVGQSLQLIGIGREASDFMWAGPADESPGRVNVGQSFGEVDILEKKIYDIQGSGRKSTLEGMRVETTRIVTSLARDGFYMQDPEGDGRSETSDGIFVFLDGFLEGLEVGDEVRLRARVQEDVRSSGDLSRTQLLPAGQPEVVSMGNDLPKPVVMGRPPSDKIDPDGIDFYEKLEGLSRRGSQNPLRRDLGVVDGGREATFINSIGGITISDGDFNPEHMQIDDGISRLGDKLGDMIGVLSYDYGNYEVLPAEAPSVITPSTFQPKLTTTLRGTADALTVATVNVLNLDPSDRSQLTKFGRVIAYSLQAPDIIGLQEVQDNSGSIDDGTVSADETLKALVEAIAEARGPRYGWREIDPLNDQDGGQDGGNIRVAFLLNPDRVTFVDRGRAGPEDSTDVVRRGGTIQLTLSPGRIDPTNDAFQKSRKPLAGEFRFKGETVFVIVNHFISRLGSCALFGSVQPLCISGQKKRDAQAAVNADFVKRILAADPHAKIVVLGDFNDYDETFSTSSLRMLTDIGLINLTTDQLEPPERFTTIFSAEAIRKL